MKNTFLCMTCTDRACPYQDNSVGALVGPRFIVGCLRSGKETYRMKALFTHFSRIIALTILLALMLAA